MNDTARVAELLGRTPRGDFEVVVRDASGDPVVVRNAPFLHDGTPMPTRYYLVGAELVKAVSRVEAAGGVDEVEAELDDVVIAGIHREYEHERDAAIDPDHVGPRPSGGVGGTRVGVKCLHAHVANELATGDDAIGRWTLARIPPTTAGVPAAAAGAESSTPVTIHIEINDRAVVITSTGGDHWEMPVGPHSLVEGELEQAVRPQPEQLTNALGLVSDHLDDVIREAPDALTDATVTFGGHHAEVLARVELGSDTVPADYVLARADADEVFRTLVAEPIDERRHNPGLPDDDVESIIGTCCIVLACMRRLELTDAAVIRKTH